MSRSKPTLGDIFPDFFAKLRSRPSSPPAALPKIEKNGLAVTGNPMEAKPLANDPTRARRPAAPKLSRAERKKLRAERAASSRRSVDTSIYRHSKTTGQSPPVIRKQLSELSADMRRLRIRAALSEASRRGSWKSAADGGGRTAILGLDFGTAFTKAVVRFEQRHYVVDWSGAVSSKDLHLAPSSFSENEDGRIVLGIERGLGWTLHDGLKMRLLTSQAYEDDDAQCDAVLFIAACFRYAAAWFPSVCRDAHDLRWILHLGLPAESWDDNDRAVLFRNLALAARNLGCQPLPLTRGAAWRSLLDARTSAPKYVEVMPEFACQLYAYLNSAQRQSDMHALMDIGAGTVDIAFFNVHEKDGEDVLPILSASVRPLGTHFLIGALAGKAGESQIWCDSDASMDDADVGVRLHETPDQVHERRSAYLSTLANAFNETCQHSKELYPTSRVWHGGAALDLFLCGGGSRITDIKQHLRGLVKQAKEVWGMSIRPLELLAPTNLEGNLDHDQFDRISVAYGLSQLRENIGKVIRRHDLEPFGPPALAEIEDRDAAR